MNRTIAAHTLAITLVAATTLGGSQVFAAPSEEVITQYNQAAEGDKDKVSLVYQRLSEQVDQQGADPLSLIYLGSTETLMGRDAWMPWNKMKYTEQGLATISKGLDLLAQAPEPVSKQEFRQGLPESLLAKAIAGTTFTSLPDMFNHFERGYDLYIDLLSSQLFAEQSYEATSWIYIYAIKAAIRADDISQAEVWLKQMQSRDAHHPMTVQAQVLVDKAA